MRLAMHRRERAKASRKFKHVHVHCPDVQTQTGRPTTMTNVWRNTAVSGGWLYLNESMRASAAPNYARQRRNECKKRKRTHKGPRRRRHPLTRVPTLERKQTFDKTITQIRASLMKTHAMQQIHGK